MYVIDGFGGEAHLAPGSNAVWLADVIILEPGEEFDELGASDRGKWRIVGEIDGDLFVAVAVITDGVVGPAGGGFVKQTSFAGL